MLDALLKGPGAYSARTGWPAWAVIPAALGILTLAALIGVLVAWGYSSVMGLGFPTGNAASGTLPPQVMLQVATWTAGLQIGIVLLTLLAAGFFSSNRAEMLALRSPAQGWHVLGLCGHHGLDRFTHVHEAGSGVARPAPVQGYAAQRRLLAHADRDRHRRAAV
jgi:hypothetical protein